MLRSSFALIALLLAPSPVPVAPGGEADDPVVLAADTEARWVPFTLSAGNQIVFHAMLDDHAVTAVLDTGVSDTLLARASPAVLPDRLVAAGQATAVGGEVAVNRMPVAAVSFGGLTRRGGAVIVTALPALATGGGGKVDLLVGADLLGGVALDIDYAARRFRMLPSGRLPFRGAAAPLTLSPSRRLYESALTLGGHRVAPMIVDTGDGAAVTVTTRDWQAAGLTTLPTTDVIAYGLAGTLTAGLAVVPALTLGALTAREVEVRIEPPGGFATATATAGRVGSAFLQNYRVLLDPGAGRLVLAPGPGADRAPQRSTSGLLVGLARDRLRVLHVMRGSPAAAAGWRADEEICRVDGVAVTRDFLRTPLATWSVGAPGRVVALGLCDGTERSLTLARFY